MKSKRLMKQVVSAIIATCMLTSSASAVFATGTSNSSSDTLNLSREEAVDIVTNLTDEQRAELSKATQEASTGQIDELIDTETSEEVRVIVEFTQAPTITENYLQQLEGGKSKTSAEELVKESHNEFENYVNGLTSGKSELNAEDAKKAKSIQIKSFYSDVFNGASVTLRGDAVEILSEAPGVKKVWLDSEVWTATPASDDDMPEMDGMMHNSKSHIGVDELHEEGVTGQGIKVGVLDTGIDYNHPDLTDTYKGYRAGDSDDSSSVDPNSVKGWDFVDNDADPMETTYDDWLASGEPEFSQYGSSYYTSHGTHVSGTIAGQGVNSDAAQNVLGVAPDAELYGYRVLGPYGSGYNSAIIGAIEKSVADGMDVINLSLGAGINDPLYPTSIAVNNAALAGVVPVVSAGNSGQYGYWTLGSPGAAPLALTVGASNVDIEIEQILGTVNENEYAYKVMSYQSMEALEALNGKEYEIINAGFGYKEDFEGLDCEGKIVIMARGGSAFSEKMENATNAGAEMAIIYNNVAGEIEFYNGEDEKYIPTFRLTREEGLAIVNLITTQGEAKVVFGETSITTMKGDKIADFSSLGPVDGTADIKPDIIAPGVNVYSTYPSFMFNHDEDYSEAYATISGTSMSAPHISGVVALILQANPEENPFEVKTRVMNTAVELAEEYSVYEIGAGRVNAYDAVHADTRVAVADMIDNTGVDLVEHETGSIRFGTQLKDEMFPGFGTVASKSFSISNNSDERKEYKASVEFTSPSVVDRINASTKLNLADAQQNNVTANIQLPAGGVIEPGKTIQAGVNLMFPGDAETGTYEGVITLTEVTNSEEEIRIPFAVRYIAGHGIEELAAEKLATEIEYQGMNIYTVYDRPLETLDVLILDGETDEVVGFASNWDWLEQIKMPGELIALDPVIKSGYFNFIDNPDRPVDTSLRKKLVDGHYKLLVVATDENGEVLEDEIDFFVDTQAPEMEIGLDIPYMPIIELTSDDFTIEDYEGELIEAFWFDVDVYDETIEKLIELGYEEDLHDKLNQGRPIIAYDDVFWAGGLGGVIPLDEDGHARIGITRGEFLNGAYKIRFAPIGYSEAEPELEDEVTLLFTREDAVYLTGEYHDDNVAIGDSTGMTIAINGAKDVTEIRIDTIVSGFGNVEYAISEELQSFADENGMEVSLEPINAARGIYNVKLTSEEGEITPINGDMNVVDITYDVVNDSLALMDISYGFINGVWEDEETVWGINPSTPRVERTTLRSDIMILIEGTSTRGWFLDFRDERVEYSAYIIDKNGVEYDLDNYLSVSSTSGLGTFNIRNDIPLQEEPYIVRIESPGHLTFEQEIQLTTVDRNGEIKNIEYYMPQIRLYAGDINGDGKIDLLDALEIYENMGEVTEENAHLDINKDGEIDHMDLAWVFKNYLITNQDGLETIKELDGVELEDLVYSTEKNGHFIKLTSEVDTVSVGDSFEVNLESYNFDEKYDLAYRYSTIVVAQYDEYNELINLDNYYINVAGVMRGVDETVTIDVVEGAQKVKVFVVEDNHIISNPEGLVKRVQLDNKEASGRVLEFIVEDN